MSRLGFSLATVLLVAWSLAVAPTVEARWPGVPPPGAADHAATDGGTSGGTEPGGEGEGEGDDEAAASLRGSDATPGLDLYLPEGELDFRLNRLVQNAFFEGQIRYSFVDADISAFLRYRYYGFARTYTIGVFDEVEFANLEDLDNDFERVRGGLFLVEWPHTFHQRSFFLAESDRITSNKEEFRFSTDRTNVFVRIGHQIGTPNDVRSNAIVGETRAKIEQLFTAPRKIGPYGAGLTGALTYSLDFLGDFEYLKAELEALKRHDFAPDRFLITRLHAGTFLSRAVVRDDPDLEPIERFAIPRTEFFKLDGRDNLRGLDDGMRGTEEIHATVELFLPWFLGETRRGLGLDWDNWYWILYGGVGTVGFDRSVYTDASSYIPDLGIGFEASVEVKGLPVFLSGIVAHAIDEAGGLKGRLSVKTSR